MPAPPSLTVHVPLPSYLSVQLPPVNSPFDKSCTQLPAPTETQRDYDRLTHDESHELCRLRGYAKQDLKAELETRLVTMDAVVRRRNCDAAAATDAWGPLSGTRRRSMDGARKRMYDPPVTLEKRRRASDPLLAFVVKKGVVKEHELQ